MGIPVDIPGLKSLVPEVPDGSMVLVEGAADPAKGYLARRLAEACGAQGRDCRFLTSRDAEEVVARISSHGGRTTVAAAGGWETLRDVQVTDHDLVVDSFSFLALEAGPTDLAQVLRRWRAEAHRAGRIVVLGIERHMLGEREQMVAEHMADGIIRFKVREEADGTRPYLQIPRWTGGGTFQKNFYFQFTGDRMMIDTRNRVM